MNHFWPFQYSLWHYFPFCYKEKGNIHGIIYHIESLYCSMATDRKTPSVLQCEPSLRRVMKAHAETRWEIVCPQAWRLFNLMESTTYIQLFLSFWTPLHFYVCIYFPTSSVQYICTWSLLLLFYYSITNDWYSCAWTTEHTVLTDVLWKIWTVCMYFLLC